MTVLGGVSVGLSDEGGAAVALHRSVYILAPVDLSSKSREALNRVCVSSSGCVDKTGKWMWLQLSVNLPDEV